MAGGLAALLDDVAALAKLAAASTDDVAAASAHASVKAAGVVVDDTAVTPQYVRGIEPRRELPIIAKIAVGSLRNKLLIILPLALLLSAFAPWLLSPLLMLGGTYLCYEGAEKIWELLTGHHEVEDGPAMERGESAEKGIVSGAVRTDLILSAEIMVISLQEVSSEPVAMQAAILVVVGILMTLLVYGAVGLLVKTDDVGLAMTRRESRAARRTGRALVAAMPRVMAAISLVGMVAMLWVGGHIIVTGLWDLGVPQPYALIGHLEEGAGSVPVIGGVLAWLVETACAFVVGCLWGGVVLAVVLLLPFGRRHREAPTAEGSDGVSDEEAVSARRAGRPPR